jgi:hypothetical protein
MSLCDVQRKIQRCLAFIDAGSEHESTVAVQQAVRLCRRHGLVLIAAEGVEATNARPVKSTQFWNAGTQPLRGSSVDVRC